MKDSNSVEDQTQDWIDGITSQFRAAKDSQELLKLGVEYLRIQYVPRVVQACWKEFVKCYTKLAPEDQGKTVVAVDLPAIFYAAWSNFPESSADVKRSVVERVLSIYGDTGAKDKSQFLIAWEHSDLIRKKKFPGYKSSRPEKEPSFAPTLKETIEAIMECGYVVLEYEGQESDDILASISYRAKLRRQNAILVTDDRDAWQCLGMGTVMYSPRNRDYTDADRLMSKHGITPQQCVDWWSMVGKNDIPKAEGIGEKTASELLGKYGSFISIYDNRSTLTPTKQKSIEDFAKNHYWLARELHTLNKGLEVLW